jgi:energy-converting hydrogenase Eha subunit C
VSGNTYLEIVIAASIFGPVVIVIVLAWFFLRGAKNDPDEQRLRRVQKEAELARRSAENERATRP